MLDFERLNGFVVDLSTKEKVEMELENVLHSEEDRKSLVEESTPQQLREFILEYYISTYAQCIGSYIFVKEPNVYQIVEDELTTINEVNELKEDMTALLGQILGECDLSQADGDLEEIVENYYDSLTEE